jgi:hypothetical protein
VGDLDGAGARFREQLRLCREPGLLWMAAEALVGVAALAARQGEEERAASLLGAAESMANVLGDPAGVKLEAEFFTPARERIGDARWRAAHADGRQLSFDAAVRLAFDGA